MTRTLALCLISVLCACSESAPSKQGGGAGRDIDLPFEESVVGLVDGGDGDAGGDGDGDGDASLSEDAELPSDVDAGDGDAGQVDAAADAAPACGDDDEDGVCNEADSCAGHNDAVDGDRDLTPDGCDIDSVLWTIELPDGAHPIVANPAIWSFRLEFHGATNDDKLSYLLEMMPNGQLHSLELTDDQVSEVRELLATSISVHATVGMATVANGGGEVVPAWGERSGCPVSPSTAVVGRILGSGTMSPSGRGSIRIEIHGYAD